MAGKQLSKAKAATILHHGSVRGHALTPAQQRLMGARASGQPVKKGGRGGQSRKAR